MAFDPSVFLNQTVSGPMSTSIKPCPEGDFPAVISSQDGWLEIRDAEIKKGLRAGQTMYIARVLFEIQSEDAKLATGRDKVLVPYDCILDFKNGTMELDTSEGKNVNLGRLRTALDQNADNQWNWGKLKGCGPVTVKVAHRSDERNPEDKYAEIRRVSKIS